MAKIRKLTPRMLRNMVLEEKSRISEVLEQEEEDSEKIDAEETDADELADSLEKDIDYMKALKIQERKLRKNLKRVSEAKKRIQRRFIKRIK